MKILHALVGYLAVALPFHPFKFALASPLAVIDYDGYVKTTQDYGNSALMKRVPGDIIEARQAEFIPDPLTVIAIVTEVALVLVLIHEDSLVRGNDVEFLVKHFDQKSSSRDGRRIPKKLSARPFRRIQNLTGLFATPPIP